MALTRPLIRGFGLAAATSGWALAADPPQCLSGEQRRAAIHVHQAVPLSRAIRATRARFGGEIIGAHLCDAGKGLVYRLTVLARDGRVTRAAVDAASGRLIGAD